MGVTISIYTNLATRENYDNHSEDLDDKQLRREKKTEHESHVYNHIMYTYLLTYSYYNNIITELKSASH